MFDRELDRRELLGYAGLGAGALILGGVPVDPALAKRTRRRGRIPLARAGTFASGVSAGIPSTTAATVWTRLHGAPADRGLFVEVAKDPDFRRVVQRKRVNARASRDFTVETRIGGRLAPGTEYFYRFETRTAQSRVGRFRTRRPPDSREPVRVAVFSCQDWQAGYYNAHRAMAAENVDFALCLGDYIYERNFYTGPRTDRLGANRDGEVQTLPEYRDKYRLYKTDSDLQELHAAHPYMAIWDDHEVEDNYAGNLAGDATENARVPFPARRRAGYRAFYEYHPFSPLIGKPVTGNDLYRRLRIGANAELFLLDERQYRDDQPCNDAFVTVCLDAEKGGRRFLGPEQMSWLKRSLSSSDAAWKIIGSQLMAMSIDVAPSQPLNKDSWDGYGAERRELLEHVRSRGISDVAFVTGDIHTFFAGDVGVNGRGPGSVATEFVCGSVTSPGIPESLGDVVGLPITPDVAQVITNNIRLVNPHIRYDQQRAKGYGLIEAREDRLDVAFKEVDSLRPGSGPRTLQRFTVQRGRPRVNVL